MDPHADQSAPGPSVPVAIATDLASTLPTTESLLATPAAPSSFTAMTRTSEASPACRGVSVSQHGMAMAHSIVETTSDYADAWKRMYGPKSQSPRGGGASPRSDGERPAGSFSRPRGLSRANTEQINQVAVKLVARSCIETLEGASATLKIIS